MAAVTHDASGAGTTRDPGEPREATDLREAGSEPGGGAPGDGAPGDEPGGGLRIGDAAARAGLSTRTLRYYEELGLLMPSSYTAGGERRYGLADLDRLARIVELREILGMNLEEIKGFLDTEKRLDEAREAYRARRGVETRAARAQRRELLDEILRLNESLAEQLAVKLSRMEAFRARLLASAERCRELLAEL
jgi:DNA-binding transcriptional MerR regulator